MKRDPLRQLGQLRQMREERAAAELARRAARARRAEIELAEAGEALTAQEASARLQERDMLEALAGQPVSHGQLFALHGRLDALAEERARLIGVKAERQKEAEDSATERREAHRLWLAKDKAVTKIGNLADAMKKRHARHAAGLAEVEEEDRPTAQPLRATGARHGD